MKMKKFAAVLSAAALAVTSFSVAASAAAGDAASATAVTPAPNVASAVTFSADGTIQGANSTDVTVSMASGNFVASGAKYTVAFSNAGAGADFTVGGDSKHTIAPAEATAGKVEVTAGANITAASNKVTVKGTNVTITSITSGSETVDVNVKFNGAGNVASDETEYEAKSGSGNTAKSVAVLENDVVEVTISAPGDKASIEVNGVKPNEAVKAGKLTFTMTEASDKIVIKGAAVTVDASGVALKRVQGLDTVAATATAGGVVITNTNAKVTNPATNIPAGALLTSAAADSYDVKTVIGADATGYVAYDIALKDKDGKAVTLNGDVLVTVTIDTTNKADFNVGGELHVYHIVGGKAEELEIVDRDTAAATKSVSFITDSFSPFVISTKALAAADATPAESTTPSETPAPVVKPTNPGNTGNGGAESNFGATTTATAAPSADVTTAAPADVATTTTTAAPAADATTTAAPASGNGADANQPTGVALAIVPAVIAAAGLVISKKRK